MHGSAGLEPPAARTGAQTRNQVFSSALSAGIPLLCLLAARVLRRRLAVGY